MEQPKMAKTETNRIEYKETLTDSFEKTAVAFLNSDGGDIFIGIRNDGSVTGVSNPDTIHWILDNKETHSLKGKYVVQQPIRRIGKKQKRGTSDKNGSLYAKQICIFRHTKTKIKRDNKALHKRKQKI